MQEHCNPEHVKDNSNNSELRFLFWARQYLPHLRLMHLVRLRADLQYSARYLYFEVLNSNLGKDFQLPDVILDNISPRALLNLLEILDTFEQPDRLRLMVVGAKPVEDDDDDDDDDDGDESTDGGAATEAPPAKQ
jgi:hypothetical protein